MPGPYLVSGHDFSRAINPRSEKVRAFSPCHGKSHAKCPSAGNSKQFTDATTVELCLSLSSESAVKTQIWYAIATYILIAIIWKAHQLDAALYTCLQILSVSIFEKTQISCALQQTISNPHLRCDANQLICSTSNRTLVGKPTYRGDSRGYVCCSLISS